jgi:hypothetical protein
MIKIRGPQRVYEKPDSSAAKPLYILTKLSNQEPEKSHEQVNEHDGILLHIATLTTIEPTRGNRIYIRIFRTLPQQ